MNGGGSTLLSAGSTDTTPTLPLYFLTQLAQTMWPSVLRAYHATESATMYTYAQYKLPGPHNPDYS